MSLPSGPRHRAPTGRARHRAARASAHLAKSRGSPVRILGVAHGTLQVRLDRLERDGVVTATGPALSPAALGHPVVAFVRIEVTRGHLDDVEGAPAAVQRSPGGHDPEADQPAEVALRERVPHRLLPLVESSGRTARR